MVTVVLEDEVDVVEVLVLVDEVAVVVVGVRSAAGAKAATDIALRLSGLVHSFVVTVHVFVNVPCGVTSRVDMAAQ